MKLSVIEGKYKKKFIRIDKIETKSDFEFVEKLDNSILFRKEYKRFIKSINKWVSVSYFYYKKLFPAEFWFDVKKKINEIKLPYTIENEEILQNQDLNKEDFEIFISNLKVPEYYNLTDENYKFQQNAVYEALNNKIASVEIAMSGGKTFIIYMYCKYFVVNKYLPVGMKILIIVPTQILAEQLNSDFKECDIKNDINEKLIVSSIYSNSKQISNANIIVGTYQSLKNYDQSFFEDIFVVICDELHKAKTYSIKVGIYDKITNAEFFFGMTGTYPKYNTLDYLNIVSMFGSLVMEVSMSDLINTGISTPILFKAIQIEYVGENKNFSKNLIENGIIGIEKYRAEKIFFQNNGKRINLIAKLLNGFVGCSLILVDTVSYCYVLKEKLNELCKNIDFEIIHGNVENRNEILDMARKNTKNKGFCIIGTYGTMSTGITIKNLEYLYFPDGGKSEIRIKQSFGRLMRLHPLKEKCIVFDLQDMLPYSSFKSHANARNKIAKENKIPIEFINVKLND